MTFIFPVIKRERNSHGPTELLQMRWDFIRGIMIKTKLRSQIKGEMEFIPIGIRIVEPFIVVGSKIGQLGFDADHLFGVIRWRGRGDGHGAEATSHRIPAEKPSLVIIAARTDLRFSAGKIESQPTIASMPVWIGVDAEAQFIGSTGGQIPVQIDFLSFVFKQGAENRATENEEKD